MVSNIAAAGAALIPKHIFATPGGGAPDRTVTIAQE